MDKAQVIQFAKLVGTKVEHVSAAGWAACRCPLAPWTHDSGKDSSPSFAIKISPHGESIFNCYTCHSGDLLLLVQMLIGYGAKAPKYNLKDAVALINAEGEGDLALPIKEYDEPPPDVVRFHPFPEDWLDSFKPAHKVPKAMAYLATRQIDLATISALEVRYDTSKKAVCFPYRDFHGRLAGLRGRFINPDVDQSSYHMYKNPQGEYNPQVWMGEHGLDFNKPVLMVESVFDLASVYRVYENVVAPLTVGFSEAKAKRMSDALEIVTLFDKGKGGDKAREKIDKYLSHADVTHLIPETDGKDPGDMSTVQLIAQLKDLVPLVKKPC